MLLRNRMRQTVYLRDIRLNESRIFGNEHDTSFGHNMVSSTITIMRLVHVCVRVCRISIDSNTVGARATHSQAVVFKAGR